MKKSILVFLTLFSINSYAGGNVPLITTGSPAKSQTETENRVYAGFVWTLQEKTSWIPDLSIGFRSLRVKSNDSVNGGEISARIKLKDGISFDSTRLSYVGGERDVLGNIGIGYSLTNSSLLGTLAVQVAYSRIGTDYQFNGNKFAPYLEVLTVDKPNKVSKKAGTLVQTCPSGYVLDETAVGFTDNVCRPDN